MSAPPGDLPLRADPQATGVLQRQQRAWYVYDWANSAYATTVIAVFLGPYLTAVAEEAVCGGPVTDATPCPVADPRLDVLGLAIAPGAYYSFLVAASVLLQVLVLPLTGAIADRTGRKRALLGLTAYVGALATAGMYFVADGRWLLGGVLYIIAQSAFAASVVIYNAFLPQLAGPDERDRVSARGWALGYLGGGLLLLANLAFFAVRARLGLTTGEAVRISLLSAGIWWGGFALIPLLGLRDRPAGELGAAGAAGDEGYSPTAGPPQRSRSVLVAGFDQLRSTAKDLRRYPRTLHFLAAYLVYNDGIQSVIALAAVYGVEELGFPQERMIQAILLVQFVAFLGAVLLARLARAFGAKRVILASLVLWTAVLGYGYALQREALAPFLVLAAGIGLVLGGSQALSRSLFSQLVPRGREAEYFSLYEISERGTSWLGALAFGLVYSATGSYRQAILSLVAFFLVGFVLLALLDVRRAVADVGNPQPAQL